jgi:hypothetical protein
MRSGSERRHHPTKSERRCVGNSGTSHTPQLELELEHMSSTQRLEGGNSHVHGMREMAGDSMAATPGIANDGLASSRDSCAVLMATALDTVNDSDTCAHTQAGTSDTCRPKKQSECYAVLG